MQALYDFTLHTLFAGFLGDDAAIRARIAARVPASVLADGWCFTLPQLLAWSLALYADAGHQAEPDWHARYVGFRQLLYGNQTNTTLRQYGGAVHIFTPHADHAQTVYVLRRCMVEGRSVS